MDKIDTVKFGLFVSQLRKEKGFTQRELAQRLFLSDKAVSKWERGLSMPDVSLLLPLSGLLDVTVTELLTGQRMEEGGRMDVRQVEELVTEAIGLSEKERREQVQLRRRHWRAYLISLVLAVLEISLLLAMGFPPQALWEDIFPVELLCLLFGGYLCLFARETLPAYYDQNKISFYSDGFFRMNLAGVRFNNSNWPHILRAGRAWMLSVPVLFPILYLGVQSVFPPEFWASARLFFLLPACLGGFIPMIAAGKKYE